MDFLSYLVDTQRLIDWRPSGNRHLYITISHECCDLDSCVSTLALAFFRYRNRGDIDHQFLPVLNMLRRDYPAKSEVRFLLDKHGILAETHLVFRDDVPERVLLRSRFILVNHHVSPFYYNTDEIYDYRRYQHAAARLPVYCQRVMLPMLCCASVIADRYASSSANHTKVHCPIVFELLHAAVLLENQNFAQPALAELQLGDYDMLLFLELYLGELKVEQRTVLYETLVRALFDLSQLTMPQILRREFKLLRATNGLRLVRIAQCCFPMAVTRFISYEFAHLAVESFASDHGCDYVLLLGTSMQPLGGLRIKELGFIPLDRLRDVEDRRIFDHIIVNLNAAQAPLLGLEPHRDLDFMQGAFYFLNVWNITFNDVLHLMQRILYDWVSEDLCG